MQSSICYQCNLLNWAEADQCKGCGAILHAERPVQEQFARQSAYLKIGLALASMIIGIISIPLALAIIGVILAPVALVMGIVALVKANKKPYEYGGRGFAITGIVTGCIGFFFIVPIVAAVTIPNLLASKGVADEGRAMSNLRRLYGAEATYISTYGNGYCGDLKTLGEKGLIKDDLASGSVDDYRYDVVIGREKATDCSVFATPLSTKDLRSFMMPIDGVMRGIKKNGRMAEKTDPIIPN